MDSAVLISAVSFGLISAFHCIGMCGPLALSLPLAGYKPSLKIAGILLYHFGRITSYAALGLLMGTIGAGIAVAGFQQVFSIIAGILIISSALLSLFHKKGSNRFLSKTIIYKKIQNILVALMRSPSLQGMFAFGMGNGLLPCGMVYISLAGAAAQHSSVAGAGFMIAFGLGTVPLMVLLSVSGMFVSVAARNRVRKLIPVVTLLAGAMLILRGMNLNIPFVSPGAAVAEGHSSLSCY